MSKHISISLSARSDDCLWRKHRLEKVGLKAVSMTGLIFLLSLLSQQPVGGQLSVLSSPDVIESQAHYSFTTPTAEYTGSSESVIIERRSQPSQQSEESETVIPDRSSVPNRPLHRLAPDKTTPLIYSERLRVEQNKRVVLK